MSRPMSLQESWVRQANKTARTVVVGSYIATVGLVGALALERLMLHRATSESVAGVKAAQGLGATILLEDERLTMSANLAAASGEERWVERYESRIPAMDAVIRDATAMAPPAAAQRFDLATREANDRLVEMERQAFAHVKAGDLQAARALLDGEAYAQQKSVLARGSDAFVDELQASVDARLGAVETRSWWLMAALLAVAAAGFLALWRRLNDHLARSESAFDAERAEVERLALHDPLTGLSNRRYLQLQLRSAISRTHRNRGGFALMVMDLDGFKPINDRYGHAAGDTVLMEMSRRLSARVRQDEVAARLGGDEFVIVLNCGAGHDDALRAAQRLIAELSEPVMVGDGDTRTSVSVGASVGIALFPADASDADELIRKADVALYRAKLEGGHKVRFFQESMDDDVRERSLLEIDLRDAIAQRQVLPYFQPLMDLATGALIGFEVLARWTHPSRGTIAPDVFIPIAEDTGQIDALTVCVVHQALLHARQWEGGHSELRVAVNIAPMQLKDERLVQTLLGLLHETGFPAARFEIEITESALIHDLELARQIVLKLKSHGIRVALDDFGTGYSSLSHLSELPFDKIKIDRSFIGSLHSRADSVTIVSAIIGLGKSLNLPTTAEGIESEADAAMLTRLGCNLGQGYLYSRPVAAADAEALIASHQAGVPA